MGYFIDLYTLCLERDSRIESFLQWIQAPKDVYVEFSDKKSLFEDVISTGVRDRLLEGSIYRDDGRWGKWGIHFIGDGAVIFSIAVPWDNISENFETETIRSTLVEFVNQTHGDFGYGAMETPPAISVQDFYDYVLTAPIPEWLVNHTEMIIDS